MNKKPPSTRRRTKRPNLTNLMPVISSCSMSYASMSLTSPKTCSPEEPGRTSLTAADFVQKTIMPKSLNSLKNDDNFCFQEKIKRQPGTMIIPDKLYLTSVTEAQSLNFLKKHDITAILTINTEPVILPFGCKIKTKFINLGDNCTSHIKSYFDEMNDFIENNERIVVHCHAGVSRSATAVIAYLMKTSRLNLAEAMKFVQSKRHIVCPNFSFMGQLRSYQDDLQVEYLEALALKDLKAENNIRKNNPIFSSKLEFSDDSGVDTSESSNESPLGSPKNKIQRIEFPNININKDTQKLQI